MKTDLSRLLGLPEAVTVNIDAVERIDAAGLQLIAAFVRERAAHDRAVNWQGESTAFVQAARLLGLAPLLRL